MFRTPTLLLALTLTTLAQVAFLQHSDRVDVTIAGRPFTTLYYGKEARKPFLFPLTTPAGIKVSRGYPLAPLPGDPTDHPHQKGLWTGAEQMSGMDFWENDPSYQRPRMGTIQFLDLTRSQPGPSTGQLAYRADWISPDGAVVIAESHSLRFFSPTPNSHAVDVDVVFTARAPGSVVFEDQQDAVIGVRLGPAFDEKTGAYPENAEGYRGEASIRGRASRWVQWKARVDGHPVGFAILDHPANSPVPARWHLRSFGFLACNPFAQQSFDPLAPTGEKTLKTGESLRLRYRVLVHDGSLDIKSAYRAFATTPAEEMAQ